MTDNRTTELTASEKVKALLKASEADYRVHHGITQGSMNYYDRYTIFIDGNPRASIDTGNGEEVVLTLRCLPEQAIAATLGEKTRDKTEEWLLEACNQATQDYVKALEKLVQDWQVLYEYPDYGDCIRLKKRMQELGIEVDDE